MDYILRIFQKEKSEVFCIYRYIYDIIKHTKIRSDLRYFLGGGGLKNLVILHPLSGFYPRNFDVISNFGSLINKF